MKFIDWFGRGKRREKELTEEIRAHLAMAVRERIEQGEDPAKAEANARREFGNETLVKEVTRTMWGFQWLGTLLQDLRYGLRQLRRNPGFATVAMATLALGIGATTVMFSLISGVLLSPLPYPQPGRLVTLHEQTSWKNQYGDIWRFAYPNFLDCQRQSRSLAMAAWRYAGGTVRESGKAEYVDGLQISSNLFSVLGIRLIRGRAFRPAEDRLGAPSVAIISYGLWQRLYGKSPASIGKPLVFEGKPYTVVGIAPPDFRLRGDTFDVFTPLGQNPEPYMQNRDLHPGIAVVGRLQPGVTLVLARTELATIGRRLAAQYPKTNAGRTFIAEPLRPDVGDAAPTLWLLMGAVSLVLLIGCVNVASLLLARAVSREHELAVRAALGASRGRLVRQCLTESGVLGLCGGALGVLLAAAGIHPFVVFWPSGLPRAQEVQLDWHVLLFALGASLLSGLLFGLAPALRVPARELGLALRAGARTVAGSSRRLHSAFVTAEITLAVVLLISAGMLGRTLLRLSSVNPGVNVRNVLVARLALSPGALANPARTRAAWRDLLNHASRVPGVQSVAMVDTVPMREGTNEIGYWPSPAIPPPDRMPLALATSVTPDYLKVMGIPLRRGRFLTEQDRMGSEPVVVIDDVLAEHAFGRQDPVGKLLWFAGNGSPFSSGTDNLDAARIVGVVGHVRQWGLAGDDQAQVRAQFYYPFAQVADPLVRRWSELMSIAVRTSVAPLSVVEPLRRAVRGDAGDQALYEIRTMAQLAKGTISQQRFLLLLFGIFAGLALLLACTGIYGVLAYLTSQRVPEFGVRMALGASARDVMQLVFRQSLGMILAGVGFGIPAALAAGRLLEHWVAGVRSIDPLTVAIVISFLVVAALFASFVPARRASRVDPMTALREE
jgi:predicted permease